MKIFAFTFFLIYGFFSKALLSDTLTAKWLGVSGLILSDQKTNIIFDPVATKPSLSHWLDLIPFKSNQVQIAEMLRQLNLKRVDASFVSHTHFDHAVDVVEISKLTHSKIYGGDSLMQLVRRNESDQQIQFQLIKNQDVIQIGDFKITAFRRDHPEVFPGFKFAPGIIDNNFNFFLYDYKEGEVWLYLIEHPLGNILFDQSSHFCRDLDFLTNKKIKIDAYFVGVINKMSMYDLVENNILKINPDLVIPVHFDFFLLGYDWLSNFNMPGLNLSELQTRLKSAKPQLQFYVPKKYEEIRINNRQK